jgi:hypothetical protein
MTTVAITGVTRLGTVDATIIADVAIGTTASGLPLAFWAQPQPAQPMQMTIATARVADASSATKLRR